MTEDEQIIEMGIDPEICIKGDRMIEVKVKKQCPFAFNQSAIPHQNMQCIEERCMAWKPALPEDKMKGKSWEALVEYIEIERVLPHEIAEEFCRDQAKGHCKLIEGSK